MTKIFSPGRLAALIFCLFSFLNVNIQAQPGPTPPQTRPASSQNAAVAGATTFITHPNTSTPLTDHPARPASASADATYKTKLSHMPPPAAPKVSLLHPVVEVKPHGAKLDPLNFAGPEEGSDSAPRGFRATAYNLRGRTASGVYVRRGVIAADPRVLPIGTVVQVKAGKYSGVYTVHDTGHRIKGRTVDIWMPSSREARTFGRRPVKLQVLRYGPRSRQTQR